MQCLHGPLPLMMSPDASACVRKKQPGGGVPRRLLDVFKFHTLFTANEQGYAASKKGNGGSVWIHPIGCGIAGRLAGATIPSPCEHENKSKK
jgi:phosphatidylserine decarboxylase